MSYLNDDRNPLILPDREVPNRPACPKCGGRDYGARRVQGVVTFTCKTSGCGESWLGGLPQEPADPRMPTPPVSPEDRPPLDFVADSKGTPIEVRRPVNLTPVYRRGSPIPEGEK